MRDRTEHFREAARVLIAEEAIDPEKRRRLSSSLIFKRAHVHTPFIITANEIRANIRAMHAFILRHRQDYLRKGRMTERERDDLEQEVGLFVKTCRQRIDVLKNAVAGDAPAQQTLAWIGGQGRDGNTNLVAHWHGVVRT